MKFNTYTQFLFYIEEKYSEDEQIIIENFISYYINEFKGFNKHNCRFTYEESLSLDKTGELHKLALLGVEIEKKIIIKHSY